VASKCHIDKRGPFVYEHAAVRVDGCEVCHSPHGSTNTRLLRRPVVFTLCLECHNGFGNFGRRLDGVRILHPLTIWPIPASELYCVPRADHGSNAAHSSSDESLTLRPPCGTAASAPAVHIELS